MESLFSEFSVLANEALDDKSFDPARIDALLLRFEAEAYDSWAAMEADARKDAADAAESMREAEAYLDSLMGAAMGEFLRASDEIDRESEREVSLLERAADAAKGAGHALLGAAASASKRYIDAAVKSAKSGCSFPSASGKVRPF